MQGALRGTRGIFQTFCIANGAGILGILPRYHQILWHKTHGGNDNIQTNEVLPEKNSVHKNFIVCVFLMIRILSRYE